MAASVVWGFYGTFHFAYIFLIVIGVLCVSLFLFHSYLKKNPEEHDDFDEESFSDRDESAGDETAYKSFEKEIISQNETVIENIPDRTVSSYTNSVKETGEKQVLLTKETGATYFIIEIPPAITNFYVDLPDPETLIPYFSKKEQLLQEEQIGSYINFCSIDYGTFEISLPITDEKEKAESHLEIEEDFNENEPSVIEVNDDNNYRSFANELIIEREVEYKTSSTPLKIDESFPDENEEILNDSFNKERLLNALTLSEEEKEKSVEEEEEAEVLVEHDSQNTDDFVVISDEKQDVQSVSEHHKDLSDQPDTSFVESMSPMEIQNISIEREKEEIYFEASSVPPTISLTNEEGNNQPMEEYSLPSAKVPTHSGNLMVSTEPTNIQEENLTEDIEFQDEAIADNASSDSFLSLPEQDLTWSSIEDDISLTYGSLSISMWYNERTQNLKLIVNEASNLKDNDDRVKTNVSIALLPKKTQRYHTSAKRGVNPTFDQTFTFKISSKDLSETAIRFRAYRCKKLRKLHIIGECFLSLKDTTYDTRMDMLVHFQKFSKFGSLSSLTGSSSNVSYASVEEPPPQIFVKLKYVRKSTLLEITIAKAINLQKELAENLRTYLEYHIVTCDGELLNKQKSKLVVPGPHPVYNQVLSFTIPLIQISSISVIVSVYKKSGISSKSLLGWISFGSTGASSELERKSWITMINNQNTEVEQWYTLRKL